MARSLDSVLCAGLIIELTMQAESLEVLEKASVAPVQARAIVRAIEIEIAGAKDSLATKQDVLGLHQALDVLRADLRGEMTGLAAELRGEMTGLAAELRGEMTGLAAELRGEMTSLAAELRGEMTRLAEELRGEMAVLAAQLRAELAKLGAELRTEMATLAAELRTELAKQIGDQAFNPRRVPALADRDVNRPGREIVVEGPGKLRHLRSNESTNPERSGAQRSVRRRNL